MKSSGFNRVPLLSSRDGRIFPVHAEKMRLLFERGAKGVV